VETTKIWKIGRVVMQLFAKQQNDVMLFR